MSNSALNICVEAFPKMPLEAGRRMHELFDAGPEDFELEAEELLRAFEPGPGMNFLLAVLASHERLIPALCRLSGDSPEVIAKLMPKVLDREPWVEVRLAQELEGAGSGGEVSSREPLMKLLDACRGGATTIPPLAGGAGELLDSFLERLEDRDERVRANAVEALWESPLPWAREVFARAEADLNPRVVANALVGIYLDGDLDALHRLLLLAGDADPSNRASAAWALGRIADPRGLPRLRQLLSEPPGAVSRNALAAMRRIGRAQQELRAVKTVGLTCLRAGRCGDSFEATLTFLSPPPLLGLKDTHWLAGQQNGWSSQIECQILTPTEPTYTAILGPQLLNFNLGAALPRRGAEFFWAPQRYVQAGVRRGQEEDPILAFHAEARMAAASWREDANPLRPVASLPTTLLASAAELCRAGRRRNIILLLTEEIERSALLRVDDLAAHSLDAGVAVHVIALAGLSGATRAGAAELSRPHDGHLLWVHDEAEVMHAFQMLAAALRIQIKLRIPAEAAGHGPVAVRYQCAGWFDEIRIPLSCPG